MVLVATILGNVLLRDENILEDSKNLTTFGEIGLRPLEGKNCTSVVDCIKLVEDYGGVPRTLPSPDLSHLNFDLEHLMRLLPDATGISFWGIGERYFSFIF